MRVLLSAYACEPNKGSEPGVGWNWALQLAREDEVWVITRRNNEAPIRRAMRETDRPTLQFLFADPPRWLTFWKRGPRGARLYSYLWQFSALRVARRAHRDIGFDLVHHVTFANVYMPALTSLLPVPFVWGPVGGGVRAPWRLAREWGMRGMVYEALRSARRFVGRYLDPLVRVTWRHADVILVQNPETLAFLPARHRGKARVCPNGGFEQEELVPRSHARRSELVAVTPVRLLHLKGVSLALRAVAAARPTLIRLLIAGDGPDRVKLQRLAASLGLHGQVEFLGWLPRLEVFRLFSVADVLLFPSMHDECGFAVIEGMAHGVVPLVLAIGGPAVLVGNAGIAVPAASRQQVIAALAGHLRDLAGDRSLRDRLGARVVEASSAFRWDALGETRLGTTALAAVRRRPGVALLGPGAP
jgi:glycosyltransferase involved in cell wall biosynthesis